MGVTNGSLWFGARNPTWAFIGGPNLGNGHYSSWWSVVFWSKFSFKLVCFSQAGESRG